jgi:hypothetical protein
MVIARRRARRGERKIPRAVGASALDGLLLVCSLLLIVVMPASVDALSGYEIFAPAPAPAGSVEKLFLGRREVRVIQRPASAQTASAAWGGAFPEVFSSTWCKAQQQQSQHARMAPCTHLTHVPSPQSLTIPLIVDVMMMGFDGYSGFGLEILPRDLDTVRGSSECEYSMHKRTLTWHACTHPYRCTTL